MSLALSALMARNTPLTPAGAVPVCQLKPSQCTISGLPVLVPAPLTRPTAHALVGDRSATALSSSSMWILSGLGTTVQAVPLKCSVSVPIAESSKAPARVPTAQASDAELAPTPFRSLLPVNAFGLGTTVNAAFAAAGAARPTAPTASAVQIT